MPNTYGKPRKKGRARHRRFDVFRPVHGRIEDVGLKLHHRIAHARPAVDFERRNRTACILFHALKLVLYLKRDRFKRRTADVRFIRTACQSRNRTARIGIPVRRTEPRKSRHDNHVVRIGNGFCKRIAFMCSFNKTEFVTQPFDERSADKHAAFKRVCNGTVYAERNRRQKLMGRSDRLCSRVHEHKAAGTVRRFRFAFVKAALTEKRRLLIADDGSDRNFETAYVFVGRRIHAR